jgi:hypothetical protein
MIYWVREDETSVWWRHVSRFIRDLRVVPVGHNV